jgi:hypothetical protein
MFCTRSLECVLREERESVRLDYAICNVKSLETPSKAAQAWLRNVAQVQMADGTTTRAIMPCGTGTSQGLCNR